MKENIIPQSSDIERVVLGAMMLEPETIPFVINEGEGLFYKPKHQLILKALDVLYTESGKVDLITLIEQLKKDGSLDKVGGEPAIRAINTDIASAAFIEDHVEILKKYTALRKLLNLGKTTVNECNKKDADPTEIIHNLESQLSEIKENMSKKKLNLTEEIREWVLSTDGHFLSTDIYRELDLSTRVHRKNCSEILRRLIDKGIIERYGDRNGTFRRVEDDCIPVDWLNAPTEPIDIKFPLEIEKYVKIMPGNIIMIAGESNSGKSAFSMNFTSLNMFGNEVHYFSSEMGVEEFKLRIIEFDDINPTDWKFKFYERSTDFSDVIKPDAINIIDFLELYDEFYKIGGIIKKIQDRLDKGIAVIAIQKNPGAIHGLGGARSIEKARLYLTMEPGKLKIVKGKIWKDRHTNPKGLEIEYKLVNGCKFIPNKSGWHYGEDK